MELIDRFKQLVTATKREAADMRVAPEPPPIDPETAIRRAVGGWIADERCQRDFVNWLTENMDKMVTNAHVAHLNPTEVTYSLGFEAGLRFVRDRLTKWAK